MYTQLKQLISDLGDSIVSEAGTVSDIGTEKQWLTERDLEIETKLSDFKTSICFTSPPKAFASEKTKETSS
jgi:hypothetical protein